MTAIAETIVEKLNVLPLAEQEKVLHYVENLIQHNGTSANGKSLEQTEIDRKRKARQSLIGIARGSEDLSSRVDEMLAEGANKREGWSLP